MLKAIERECLLKFLGYNEREFLSACRDAGVKAESIKKKLGTHKTEANKYRPRPLTLREECSLSAFLRRLGNDFKNWCYVYEVDQAQLQIALKRMIRA
ncbi:hypothetical protein ABN36_18335 [Salmonella enterica subsp. enterica]|uniref:hypothetical protein n=1 Tax=Salmonella enterica TaxID=28901 RepID=UPI0009B15557|nr:hypothetical protein [Salmonella enterica]ECH9540621.1 hypothetical protein [Salmonella enterica subsp. enterica]EGG4120947.1 hypothetical protein [Salmonella enterica]EGG4134918.1 hypothetical protein [Salmonella enterica]EGI6509437.1 hypothetical protein [Salmonella enterica subsp. enterica serovar Durham]